MCLLQFFMIISITISILWECIVNAIVLYFQDKQVPVCPLCNKPIPLQPGQVADVEVSRHIDTDCQSDPAKERRKVREFNNITKLCQTLAYIEDE